MITYYEDRLVEGHVSTQLFFDLQNTPAQFKDDNVDIQFVLEHNINEKKNAKIKAYIGIFDNEEDQIKKFLRTDPNCYLLTNAVDYTVNDERIIFTDFLFNITRAFYTKTGYNKNTPLWYYAGNDCYVLNDLNFDIQRNKIFVGVNNTYRDTLHVRPIILNYLLKNKDKGYIGDGSNVELYLPGEGHPVEGSRYRPVANKFYNNAYLSIYGESIEDGTSYAITEKTFEPMIKGHFILPFSACGFIKHLKSWGVYLPSFINYEYDCISDYKVRYQLYHEEMMRLINIPLAQWHEFYVDNKEIILHNRQILFDKPFHTVEFERLLAHSSVG